MKIIYWIVKKPIFIYMKKLKNSKYKNTGILFELLVRQISSDILNNKHSKAIDILKEFFGKKTALSSELKLYRFTTNQKFNSEYKASEFLNILVNEHSKLNKVKLNREKYNLIKEIKNNFDLDEFFKYKVSNYKENASIYKILEYSQSENPIEYVETKSLLIETLTDNLKPTPNTAGTLNEDYVKQPKEVRMLAWKFLVDSFNNKYTTLSQKQKQILKEYINSVDNSTKLKQFVLKETTLLEKSFKNIKTSDTVLNIKLSEVTTLINNLKSAKVITESEILSLLKYHELLVELKKITK